MIFSAKKASLRVYLRAQWKRMLEAEMTEHLGYEPYEAKGRNSGNSRNGHSKKKLRSSAGSDMELSVPRDRQGEFEPQIVRKYESSSNELEDKILTMYAKGLSTCDISAALNEMYGMEVSAQTISKITDKVMPLVEAWQSRPLERIYPILSLDAIHFNLKKEHKVENRAHYVVLGLDLEGKKDVLGHWVFTKPASRELGETKLLELAGKRGEKCPMAVRSWENNWNDLATFFDYTPEIRRLIYTTNPIEAYNRQLRKVTKTKGLFPTYEAVRKLLWLVHRDIVKKWSMPVHNWAMILNQLAIRFEARFPI